MQDAVKAKGAVTSYVMTIAGRAGTPVQNDESFISLQQVESLTTLAASGPSNLRVATPQRVGLYLYPNTLSGILVMLFVALVMIMGFLLLKDVQTPVYFPTDKIDFGKIEK